MGETDTDTEEGWMGQRRGPQDDTFTAHFGSWIPLAVLAVIMFAVSRIVGSCIDG
jgi:hypothetical protein